MSKQHYIEAARIAREIPQRATRELVARSFIALFEAFNGRFDRVRFLAACDVSLKGQ